MSLRALLEPKHTRRKGGAPAALQCQPCAHPLLLIHYYNGQQRPRDWTP